MATTMEELERRITRMEQELARLQPSPGGMRTRWTTDRVSCRYRLLQSSLTSKAGVLFS